MHHDIKKVSKDFKNIQEENKMTSHHKQNIKESKMIKIYGNYADFAKRILAVVPFYAENGGNFTKIYLSDNTYAVIKNKATTVVNNIAKAFTLSLEEMKDKYKVLIGRTTAVPLPMSPHLTLVPLKYRQPLMKDDGAAGFFAIEKIKAHIPKEKNTTSLVFKDGLELPVLQSHDSVGINLKQAELVKWAYLDMLQLGPDIFK